ncbi:Protein F07C3.3, partial [Aphelenchoides avenae]
IVTGVILFQFLLLFGFQLTFTNYQTVFKSFESIRLVEYAQYRDIPVRDVPVVVTHSKNTSRGLQENDAPALVPDAGNENEVKAGIAADGANDQEGSVVDTMVANGTHAFISSGVSDEEKLYGLDYSVSHPFESQCRFPVLRKDEPDIRNHVRHYLKAECPPPKYKTPLVSQLRRGEILIGRPHRSTLKGDFRCYMREISGTLRPKRTKVTEVGPWASLPQNQRIFIEKDQFLIKCLNATNATVYLNAYTNVPDKARIKPPDVGGDRYSTAVFVIDSTARNQFFRHMPLTMKFMRDMNFQILHGHTKVGDNSAINLLPILAGKVFDPNPRGMNDIVRKDMIMNSTAMADDFWTHAKTLIGFAKDKGYATLWNDDIANSGYGLFNYYMFPGFRKPPADYYYR